MEPEGCLPASLPRKNDGPDEAPRPSSPSGRPPNRRARGACGCSAPARRGSGPGVDRNSPPVPAPMWVAVTSAQQAIRQPLVEGAALPVRLLGVEEEPLVETAHLASAEARISRTEPIMKSCRRRSRPSPVASTQAPSGVGNGHPTRDGSDAGGLDLRPGPRRPGRSDGGGIGGAEPRRWRMTMASGFSRRTSASAVCRWPVPG